MIEPRPYAGDTAYAKTGWVWLRGALSEAELKPFDDIAADHDGKPGARLAHHVAFSYRAPLGRKIAALCPGMVARRALVFNKTEAQNWGVPWHQDRVIAVAQRHDLQGFHNWSHKQGVWHCEPPLSVLNQMLFVRLHLDASDAENGAMQIALGSHQEGLVPDGQAAEVAQRYPVETCAAQRGDVLILPMLTLHASRPARLASTRRTLRVDYAALDLPTPLHWAQ